MPSAAGYVFPPPPPPPPTFPFVYFFFMEYYVRTDTGCNHDTDQVYSEYFKCAAIILFSVLIMVVPASSKHAEQSVATGSSARKP